MTIKKFLPFMLAMTPFASFAMENAGGVMNLTDADMPSLAIDPNGLINKGPDGTITVNATDMTVAEIENNQTAGNFTINLSRDLTVNGQLNNSSDTGIMDILVAGDVYIDGPLNNDSNTGRMLLDANSLIVNGAFQNKGSFDAEIKGATVFRGGFDFNSMPIDNSFKLVTGTLSGINDIFNHLNSFEIDVTDGGLNLGHIVNGANDDTAPVPVANANANLTLRATSVSAGTVINQGAVLDISTAENSGGDIDVSGTVGATGDAVTIIAADGALKINGAVNNDSAGIMTLNGQTVSLGDSLTNSGAGDLNLLGHTDAAGSLSVVSNVTNTGAGNMELWARNVNISGQLINSGTGTMTVRGSDTNAGTMNVGTAILANSGVINVNGLIGSVSVNGDIDATGGTINFGTNTVNVYADAVTANGNITTGTVAGTGAGDINFLATGPAHPTIHASTVNVTGNVGGGLGLVGLTHATIGGNYTFDNYSRVHGIIRAGDPYWGTVSASLDGTMYNLDDISGASDSLITVGGQLITNLTNGGQPQIGLTIYDTINASDAIKLITATGGISDTGALDMADVGVNFCNANGSMCFDYFSNANRAASSNPADIPAHLTVWNDNEVWVVFDPALMRDIGGLFNQQPREIEQIQNIFALNDHTLFRDFEDRMIDEFVWDRLRWMDKAWIDVSYGITNNTDSAGVDVKGTRINIMGGFDWQTSETQIWGLVGHFTMNEMTSSLVPWHGHTIINLTSDLKVSDTNVGIGGYMMHILSQSWRLYGNVFFDYHMLETSRDQTFTTSTSGDGTSFGLTSEWGLMHDWLNEYLVGNLYARAGYNFGWDITQKGNNVDYMTIESDGYFHVTPGYSLTLQKRIYPSVGLQLRPYLSAGVEYDVLRASDSITYKFDGEASQTYKYEIDPLWAFGGAGIEVAASASWHMALDYRYNYNADISMHTFKLTGMVRF